MGNLFKGVHLLTQSEYNTLSANEQLDPDVLYATPENVTELVRLHTEQISENSTNIARNKEDIESLKKSPGGSSEDIVEIKNTINEIILRDSTQDNRLLNIEEKFATDVVDLASTQTITGPKTFTEHIYLANADGTVDRISHLNNNFIIHSGATNSAALNIDEGLEKIYAFNNELAFKSDITKATDALNLKAGVTVVSNKPAVIDSPNIYAIPRVYENTVTGGEYEKYLATGTGEDVLDGAGVVSSLIHDTASNTARIFTKDISGYKNPIIKLSFHHSTDFVDWTTDVLISKSMLPYTLENYDDDPIEFIIDEISDDGVMTYHYSGVLYNSWFTDVEAVAIYDGVYERLADVADLTKKANTDLSNVTVGIEKTDLLYDMSSSNSSINWGYTSGISDSTISKDFSKYKFLRLFVSNCGIFEAEISKTFRQIAQAYNLGANGAQYVYGFYGTIESTSITFKSAVFTGQEEGVPEWIYLYKIEGVY